jgi:hypothetical protein
MVEMDDLRKTWAEYDRKLDTNIRLSRQLLMATTLNRVRSPLRRLAFFLGLEVVGWGVIIVALGNFIYEHISMARFAVPAVALDLYSIGMLNSSYGRLRSPCRSTMASRSPLSRNRLRHCGCCVSEPSSGAYWQDSWLGCPS